MSLLQEPDVPAATPAPVSNRPFAHRDFVFYYLQRVLNSVAIQMQSVAIGWQIYDITGRAVDLGFVGLALFAPALVLMLVTGHAADRFDRRNILLCCFAVEALCCAGLSWMSARGLTSPLPIYLILIVFGSARAFVAPASNALATNTVPREALPAAIAWTSSGWQLATIGGPALGGFAYAYAGGAEGVYAIAAGLVLLGICATTFIRPKGRPDTHSNEDEGTWTRAVAGLKYIRSRPAVLGAITLDMVAVLCGGATALLPIFARDVLGTGPEGLGFLRASPAIGALSIAILLATRPLGRRAGATMLFAVIVFGAMTILFGLSKSLPLSMLALALLGAADMFSVNVRSSLIQLSTPDRMRGRVGAANAVFIGASNELGELRAGFMAAWLGAVPAVIVGGIGTIVITATWAALFPALGRVDRLSDIKAE
ncbi:MFS transporter [Roseiterribacter gracilis]|uniref:MFS transporter n=1 Tax=Roseiterribacter gracilis TaxID=2812848 RepID=A0A8S8XB91_9PROT|nr:MFS transporter [Rhodospirillales bacterium TMPK1]